MVRDAVHSPSLSASSTDSKLISTITAPLQGREWGSLDIARDARWGRMFVLWGESARSVIVAIGKAVEDAKPVHFVHVGGASREENIELPGAALRSSAIELMGSEWRVAKTTNVFEPVLAREPFTFGQWIQANGYAFATSVHAS